jgi:cytochrome c oxidase subunit 4
MDSSENRTEAGRTYVLVWAALMTLTAVTVAMAGMNLRKITIIVCLGIAAFKSLLVLLYFMHLRYENRMVIKLIIPIAIIVLAIFIGGTFSDVFTR